MRATMLSLAAAAALLSCLTGCSAQRAQVARGQAPTGATVNAQGEELCPEDCVDSRWCRFCRGCGCCRCRPYRVPTNLMYPPADELPAIVQYPYYTCKGPDCFFKE